jgi:hypothetical protein
MQMSHAVPEATGASPALLQPKLIPSLSAALGSLQRAALMIIPAPTVSLVASSMTMKAPVARFFA